ncbi:hypothetical protein BDQ17DRAFT_1374912 [Cyathus striatus]|nr:hypothetical protein BDQ17DRAFT_1374912 [Cyathus striatus]
MDSEEFGSLLSLLALSIQVARPFNTGPRKASADETGCSILATTLLSNLISTLGRGTFSFSSKNISGGARDGSTPQSAKVKR